MRIILSLIILLNIVACSTSETIIKPKEVKIEIPAITVESDSFKVIESDNFVFDRGVPSFDLADFKDIPVYEAEFTIPNATDKAIVKVNPKSKKATLILPKQNVSQTILDTTKLTIKKTTTTAEKFGYGLYGIIFAIILIILGWLVWNKYGKILK